MSIAEPVRCVVMTTKGCRSGARARLACAHAASSKAHRVMCPSLRICFGLLVPRDGSLLDGSPLSATYSGPLRRIDRQLHHAGEGCPLL